MLRHKYVGKARHVYKLATPSVHSVLLAVLMAGAAGTAWASTDGSTLKGALQQALDENPEIRSRVEAFYASKEDRREAFGGYLPSIDANASIGSASREYDGRGSFSRNFGELSLTQMLFDGFRVKNRVARFDHLKRARYYELLDEMENKALEVADAYLGVQRYRSMVELAEQNLANHMQTYESILQRARNGVGNNADLQQVTGRLALARSNLITEQSNLQTVTARYQRLVGSAPSVKQESVFAQSYKVPTSMRSMLTTSYANNPGLYMAFESARAAEAALGEAKSERYPTLEFGARSGLYKNNNGFDSSINSDSYGDESLVELRMRYNLYRGGSDRAAERAAHRRINQAEDLRDKACVDLRQTATIAYSDVRNLQQQVKSLYMHKSAQEKVLVAYKEQFEIGRRSLLDVLDAENESFQAERAHVNGNYDLTQAKFRTLHGMGYLLRTFSVDRQNIPDLKDLWDGNPAETAASYCTVNDDAYVRAIKLDPLSSDSPVQRIELESDALFDLGSATIKPDSVEALRRFVGTLRGQTPRLITVTGHTDKTGTDAINRKLSLDRAQSVRDFLVAEGVKAGRIDIEGRGSSQPIASEATAAGRAQNRRVELHVHQ